MSDLKPVTLYCCKGCQHLHHEIVTSCDCGTGCEPFEYELWEARRIQSEATKPAQDLSAAILANCTCPSGDGSLRWPCPQHPPLPVAITDKTGPNGIKWYVEPNLPDGINLYIKDSK